MNAEDSDTSPTYIHGFHPLRDTWAVGGYRIYVECGVEYTDAELMEHLGISGYSLLLPEDIARQGVSPDQFIQIANDGRWAQIADGDRYQLWHSKDLRDRIADFAKLHNIFTCSFGDADNCFDFEYYEGSELRRRFEFLVPLFHDEDYKGRVAMDFGAALLGEEQVLEEVGMYEKVNGIAAAIGIEADERKLSIRTYIKPYPKRSFLDRLLRKPDPSLGDYYKWHPYFEFE